MSFPFAGVGVEVASDEKIGRIRNLVEVGKEKGYLLYEEVNEMLPTDIHTSDELDDVFANNADLF